MAGPAGERGQGWVFVVAGLVAFSLAAGLAFHRIPALIGLAGIAGTVILLAVRGAAELRGNAAARTEAQAIRDVFSASGAVLGTLDVARVLRAAAEAAARLTTHASAALVYLIEDGNHPILKHAWGLEGPTQEQGELPPVDIHVKEAAKTRKTVAVPLPGPGYRSACALPLKGKAGLVGVLALLSHKPASTFRAEIPMLEYFGAQTALAIENAGLYRQVQDMFVSSITALAAAVDAKDAYTHGHSEDIAELATLLARELHLPPQEVEKIRLAGLLHDVGKIGIPDAILRKPGKLDPAERAIMMTHVTLGASIIDKAGPLRDLVAIVRHHHEHYNGHGYPDGLRGSEIPIGSAILAVADAFDAMTSHRAYHAARSVDAAVEELQLHAGTQFHPQVVDGLTRILEQERATGSAWYRALETRIDSAAAPPPAASAPGSEEAALVWQSSQQVRDATDLPQLLAKVATTAAELVSATRSAVLLLDERAQMLSVEAATPAGPAPGSVFPRNRSVLWRAIEQRAAQRSEDGSVAYVPLVSGGQAVGVLQVEAADERALRLVSLVAETAAPAIQAALLRVRAERSAGSDDLTGLLNRRALVTRLHQETARHHRYGTRFALLLGDIVALRQFNAQHGYDAGDDLIRRSAELLSGNVRQVDFPARLHGGRFAVLMPELDRSEADRALRRLQPVFADREVTILGRFTQIQPLRWAVVSCPADGTDADALLAQAEQRLRTEPERSPC